MNKAEFIKAIEAKMEEQGFPIESKAQAERLVNAHFEVIMDAVASGDNVRISGFGNFYGFDMKARMGQNMATGEPMEIPAKRVPKFKAGATFKQRVLGDAK